MKTRFYKIKFTAASVQVLNCQPKIVILNRHWLRLPALGNNNKKLGLPERLSAGIQFRFRNLFHKKISGNRNFLLELPGLIITRKFKGFHYRT